MSAYILENLSGYLVARDVGFVVRCVMIAIGSTFCSVVVVTSEFARGAGAIVFERLACGILGMTALALDDI